VLKWAAQHDVPLPAALDRITAAPARVMGIHAGTLAPGAPADICIFDPQAFWAVTPQTLRSQGKNTPFERRELQGRVTHTLVGGRLVFKA
jgi:dihydroorotase